MLNLLFKEYQRYLAINRVFAILDNGRDSKRIGKALIRFLIEEKTVQVGGDPILPYFETELPTQTLIKKLGSFYSNPSKKVELAKKESLRSIELINNSKETISYSCVDGRRVTYKVGIKKFLIPKEIFLKLKAECLFSNYEVRILILLIRYRCLSINDDLSYQLAVTEEKWDRYDRKYHIDHELFASPINCKSKSYCSLFDIDNWFGSLGNYKDNILKLTGMIECNPPFTELIHSQMTDLIFKRLAKEEPAGFVVFVANWSDSHSYQKMKNSPYLVEARRDDGRFVAKLVGKKVELGIGRTVVFVLMNDKQREKYASCKL